MMKSIVVMLIILGAFPCFTFARSHQHQQDEPHHRHHHQLHNQQKQLIEKSNDQNRNIPINRNISTSSTVLDRRRTTISSASSVYNGQSRRLNHSQKFSLNNGYGPNFYNRNYNGWSITTNQLGGNNDRSGVMPGGTSGYLPKDVEQFDEAAWKRGTFEHTTTTTQAPTVFRTGRGKHINKNNIDRRNVCIQHKTIQIPVKTTEVYSRPTWRHVSEPCQVNQVCTRVEMVHEPAYRDVIRHKTTKQAVYTCCPGWEKTSKASDSCMRPVCKFKCRNGGTCITADTCSCPAGFTGKFCEKDVNECKEEKPCDQLCYNTEGSYFCKCRDGFVLHTDKQSCRKIGGGNHAFEARDLENEIDQDDLSSRLRDIEHTIGVERLATNDLHMRLRASSHIIDSLKMRVNTLESRQQEINDIQEKLRLYDASTRRFEHLIDILFKCRSNPHNPSCP